MKCLYCPKPVVAREMCRQHYSRWYKTGDPHQATIAPRGAALAFLRDHVDYIGEECVLWPFKAQYRQGYGSVWFEGRLTGAHRLMCRLAHGEPPAGFEAAHACHNRLCVNPNHLRWSSRADNLAERRVPHGECGATAKLHNGQVRKIREMVASGMSHGSIANEFGVARRTISAIASRTTWKELA